MRVKLQASVVICAMGSKLPLLPMVGMVINPIKGGLYTQYQDSLLRVG